MKKLLTLIILFYSIGAISCKKPQAIKNFPFVVGTGHLMIYGQSVDGVGFYPKKLTEKQQRAYDSAYYKLCDSMLAVRLNAINNEN